MRIIIIISLLTVSLFAKSQAGCFVQASCKQTISVDSALIFGSVISTTPTTQVWKFVSGPAIPVLSAPGSTQTTVKGMKAPGTYIFSLTASNSTGSQMAMDTVIRIAVPKSIVRVQTFYSDSTSSITK